MFKCGNLEVAFVMNKCALCDRKVLTRCYYEDDIVWIADCYSCHIPIIVLKRHTMEATKEELEHMNKVLDFLFPKRVIRKEQKQIHDHLHWHVII